MKSLLSFRGVFSASLALLVLGVSLGVLRDQAEPGLAAEANQSRTDQDGDGLSDAQELVLGTLPFRADSDRDTYSDLEEVACDSDPLIPSSVPEDALFAMGSCASEENGYVKMLVTLRAGDDALNSLRLVWGVVHDGRAIRLAPRDFRYSIAFLQPGRDLGSRLAVLEVGVPTRLVHRLGRIHLFAVLGSTLPGTERVVTTQSFASVGGVVVSIMHRRLGLAGNSGGGAQGVIYRPLASDDQLAAAGWETGKVCFQRTAAVGSSGASIVYEVDGADCIPMDTQCSPSDCAAGVGTSLDLPDPAALIGG